MTINLKGLTIIAEQSLESMEWLKIVYLVRKGYTREEAVAFLPRLASGEIRGIDSIPDKQVMPSKEGKGR